MKKIGKAASDYLSKVRHMSPEKRTSQLNQTESMFSKSKEFGDDKVNLAMQTYEMVCITLKYRFEKNPSLSLSVLVCCVTKFL